ncbi:hypothetical protein GGR55DRAFT_633024 [Xylaria sp. FL0064]|nr:hypothetical protein GGR55DRAFT_633024 [Xylaria sp. FL0064]
MAGPGARARLLNNYFLNEHAFHAEKYAAGNIIYRRVTLQDAIERVVVKHIKVEFRWRDEEIDLEEDILRKLWGSEHIIRLLSVVHNQYHRGSKWSEPRKRARQNPPPILPWKLRFDPNDYVGDGIDLGFRFFVMEYLPRGDGRFQLIRRCRAHNIEMVSEQVFFYSFLCLTRGCIGIAYPPNVGNRKPAAVVREKYPVRTKRKHSKITHGDLHLGNIMFGDYDDDIRNNQPRCHEATPVLKIIDFGMADTGDTPYDSECRNLFQAAELIHQLARLEQDPIVDSYQRERNMARNITGFADFDTYASEDFIQDESYSQEFRDLVCMCMAVEPENRLRLQPLLRRCEHHLRLIEDWMELADEVTMIFDVVPVGYVDSDSDDSDNDVAEDDVANDDIEDDDAGDDAEEDASQDDDSGDEDYMP